MNDEIKVGDKVYFPSLTGKKYYGILKEKTALGTTTVQFEDDFTHKFGRSSLYEGMHICLLKKAFPELTQEQRTLLKCQTLWNESKYVKYNPKFAY